MVRTAAEAIRFARFERQKRPQSVIMLPDDVRVDSALGLDPGVDPAMRK
jgi:hypothetical protein